jgi:hypothetical protein
VFLHWLVHLRPSHLLGGLITCNHHCTFCFSRSQQPLKLLSWPRSYLLPLLDHFLWPSPSHTLYLVVPRLPGLLYSLFSSSPCNLVLSSSTSLKMSPHHNSSRYGKQQKLSCPMLACHAWGVTVLPNLCTQVKAWGKCLLVSQLGLPVCGQGCLPYLVVEALSSPYPQKRQGWSYKLFLVHSVAFLFHYTFQLSHFIFHSSWCSYSHSPEHSLSFVTLTFLIHGVQWRKFLLCHIWEEFPIILWIPLWTEFYYRPLSFLFLDVVTFPQIWEVCSSITLNIFSGHLCLFSFIKFCYT